MPEIKEELIPSTPHICDECWCDLLEENVQLAWGRVLCSDCFNNNYITCVDCWEVAHINDSTTIASGDTVCEGCSDCYNYCERCNERHHEDNTTYVDRHWIFICDDCVNNWYRCICDNCWELEHEDDMYNGLCSQCEHGQYDEDDTDYSWSYNQEATTTTTENNVPKQDEVKLSADVIEQLDNFYCDQRCVADYVWHYIKDIKWSFKFNVTRWLPSTSRISWMADAHYRGILEHNIRWIKDWKVWWMKAGKWFRKSLKLILKARKEKWTADSWILDVFTQPQKEFDKAVGEMCKSLTVKENELSCEFNNSPEWKMESVKYNDMFWSCQVCDNTWTYSRWLYDLVCNWWNAVALIKDGTEVVWRVLLRYFLDKDGKEYLCVERLYLNGWTTSVISNVLNSFIHWLSKATPMTVIITNKSSHATSGVGHIEGEQGEIVNQLWTSGSLRQPSRSYDFKWESKPCYYRECWSKDYIKYNTIYSALKCEKAFTINYN